MGVLVEANSVIVNRESINKKYPGGWSKFVSDVPNRTLCFDEYLARVGFMEPKDAEGYIRKLEQRGLTYLQKNNAVDIVEAFQTGGLSANCDWAEDWEYYLDPEHTKKISVCFSPHEKTDSVKVPEGWKFEDSVHLAKNLIFLRHKNGVDVYHNNESGKEVYVGRVKSDAEEPSQSEDRIEALTLARANEIVDRISEVAENEGILSPVAVSRVGAASTPEALAALYLVTAETFRTAQLNNTSQNQKGLDEFVRAAGGIGMWISTLFSAEGKFDGSVTIDESVRDAESIDSFVVFLRSLDPMATEYWDQVYSRIYLNFSITPKPEVDSNLRAAEHRHESAANLLDSVSKTPKELIDKPSSRKAKDTKWIRKSLFWAAVPIVLIPIGLGTLIDAWNHEGRDAVHYEHHSEVVSQEEYKRHRYTMGGVALVLGVGFLISVVTYANNERKR